MTRLFNLFSNANSSIIFKRVIQKRCSEIKKEFQHILDLGCSSSYNPIVTSKAPENPLKGSNNHSSKQRDLNRDHRNEIEFLMQTGHDSL